jgi:hypothetical protein
MLSALSKTTPQMASRAPCAGYQYHRMIQNSTHLHCVGPAMIERVRNLSVVGCDVLAMPGLHIPSGQQRSRPLPCTVCCLIRRTAQHTVCLAVLHCTVIVSLRGPGVVSCAFIHLQPDGQSPSWPRQGFCVLPACTTTPGLFLSQASTQLWP